MPVEKVDVRNLHHENKVWKNELLFVADEIQIYENRLSDLVSEKASPQMLKRLEQFQNQFIREKEVIDQLKHDVNSHEHTLVEYVRSETGNEDLLVSKHEEMNERMIIFRKIFAGIKDKFYHFLAEYL
ncbi:MAG: hypothetical protein KDC85_10160 [Saprospiraceae bacterium]|nr:hypothetical protein [Saprospiraceae bacterium]MCB9323702.1 hypothetical protein [Lewinellaceae bacterium]